MTNTRADIDRLVDQLENRDFETDDLIFLKIKTYFDNKKFLIRTGMEKYDFNSDMWYPYPFSFIKENTKGKFKFLPIRLQQFEHLLKLNDENSLREDFIVKKQWEMEINLNISGDCWDDVQKFPYKGGREVIGNISELAKDAIMAHLLSYIVQLTDECKAKYGGMWMLNPYRSVCYTRKAEYGRWSVSFVMVECCRTTFRQELKKMEGRVVPIECENLEGSVTAIKQVVCFCAVIIFLFLPLTVKFVPCKPEPYKLIIKSKESQQGSDLDRCPDGNGRNQTPKQRMSLLW